MEETNNNQIHNEDAGVESEQLTNDIVELPTGKALSAEEVYPITAEENSIFAVVLGATGSGKTTLITSLYQIFLSGGTSKYYFAGSRTLSAFEERAFYTRTASYANMAETPRTPRGSLDTFLHLRLYEQKQEQYKNIILSDFSGEDYADVIANVDAAIENFKIVCRAKKIIVLLDGKNIAGVRKRTSELQNVIQLLRTFTDGNLVNNTAEVVVVISKYDLIVNSRDESLDSFIKSIKEEICTQIPSLKSRIILLETAAMPDNTETLQVGFGMEELLDNLTNMPRMESISNLCNSIESISQFDLYSRSEGIHE